MKDTTGQTLRHSQKPFILRYRSQRRIKPKFEKQPEIELQKCFPLESSKGNGEIIGRE